MKQELNTLIQLFLEKHITLQQKDCLAGISIVRTEATEVTLRADGIQSKSDGKFMILIRMGAK